MAVSLLIVDDEILDRIGLKTIITMGGDEFDVVGEASSGTEALAILERTPCDIVLTDIRMPDMDGLELLKHIQERWPETKTVILSNYSDFDYVRTALRLGADEYIAKLEIEPEEVLGKLGELKAKLLAEREKRREVLKLESKATRYGREVKEKRLRELLLRPSSRQETDEWLREFDVATVRDELSVALVRIARYESLLANNRFESERLLQFTVGNVLAEMLKKYGGGELVSLEDGHYAVVSAEPARAMLEEMDHAVRTFLKLSLRIGVSRPRRSVYALHEAYEEAREALDQLFYDADRERIVERAGMRDYAEAGRESWSEETWLRLIEEQDEAGLCRLLREWTESTLAHPRMRPAALREQWIRLADCFARSLKAEGADIYSVTLHEGHYPHHVIRQGETLADIRDWFLGWMPVFLAYKRQHGRHKWRSEVQTVARLIQERYHLPLKVSELAAEVGFTENYLSILFKKETGETITDYITRTRMKLARELLKNPENKIYEVSERVGYADPNHFSRSFKQLEGMYPTEFRKLVLGK